jgi:acyl-CoA thioester hydrolase
LYRSSDMELVATGASIQVFMDLKQELYITQPEFFLGWKKKYLYKH